MYRNIIVLSIVCILTIGLKPAFAQEWTLPITVTGETGSAPNYFTVYIGGGNQLFLPAPPPPPQYLTWAQLYEHDWSSGPYSRMVFNWPPAADTTIWMMMVDPNGNVMPPISRTSTAVWNPDNLPAAGMFSLKEYFSGMVMIADMRAQDSLSVTGTTDQYFNIICVQTVLPVSIEVSAEELDFGLIPVGGQADLVLTIYNSGSGVLALNNIFTSAPAFYTDYDPADSLISAGDSLELVVTFQPEIARIYEESLSIVSNASNEDTMTVSLYGDGGAVPDSVRNLVIMVEGGDAILTWDEVNMSVSGYPLSVDCYLIFFEEDYGEVFNFLTYTTDTSCTHIGAGQFAPSMFYFVEAYIGDVEVIDALLSQNAFVQKGELYKLLNSK